MVQLVSTAPTFWLNWQENVHKSLETLKIFTMQTSSVTAVAMETQMAGGILLSKKVQWEDKISSNIIRGHNFQTPVSVVHGVSSP